MKPKTKHEYIVEYASKNQYYVCVWVELFTVFVENGMDAIRSAEKYIDTNTFYIRARLIK